MSDVYQQIETSDLEDLLRLVQIECNDAEVHGMTVAQIHICRCDGLWSADILTGEFPVAAAGFRRRSDG